MTLGDPSASAEPALVARALSLAQAGDLDPDRILGVQGPGSRADRRNASRSRARSTGTCAAARPCSPSTSPARRSTPKPNPLSGGAYALADAGAVVLLVSHRRSARDIADRVVTLS